MLVNFNLFRAGSIFIYFITFALIIIITILTDGVDTCAYKSIILRRAFGLII